MNFFYEKNTELLESNVNKTFDEILAMDDKEFHQWVVDLRKTVVDLWDKKGLPPRVGYNKDEIIENFRNMVRFPVHTIEVEKDVIRNTSVIGNAVNQWFPTMMKTKISYSSKGEPKSIYDYFADEKLLSTFVTYANRHFKRDSFYHYSNPISEGDIISLPGVSTHKVTTAENFIEWFEKEVFPRKTHDYFLCPVKENKVYTGYNTKLSEKKNIIVDVSLHVPTRCATNVSEKWNKYSIRLFKKGQKLFPLGLKAFRVSFCQYAVNFPPLTARYLYERFTDHIINQDNIIIYDPSAGWGGRLLGALAVSTNRTVTYVGNDPNRDHNTGKNRTKYHEIADFFNKYVRKSGTLFSKEQNYEIFQTGSEVIGNDPRFQKYKGKVDMIFTSPPYFSKEVYSDDIEQSCHKFDNYVSWRDGFLKPTLETCVEYLASDRYLLWNIADIAMDGKLLPLEQDSKNILESLDMEYVTTIKMTLAAMPGGNRFIETGEVEEITRNTVYGKVIEENKLYTGLMKNFVTIKTAKKDMMLKFEPIFVYRKK